MHHGWAAAYFILIHGIKKAAKKKIKKNEKNDSN